MVSAPTGMNSAPIRIRPDESTMICSVVLYSLGAQGAATISTAPMTRLDTKPSAISCGQYSLALSYFSAPSRLPSMMPTTLPSVNITVINRCDTVFEIFSAAMASSPR